MSETQKKRLLVFFFYDKDGVVDGYLRYFLDDLTQNVTETIVVCNGKLNAAGRTSFEKYTDKIIVRENKGLDVWAYKTGLEYYGWDKLAEFDEVILANSTMMGPVYPFEEMFNAMDQKEDLDFWGITLYHGSPVVPFGCNPYGCLPLHIQSHFIVYRQRFVKSLDLQLFWKDMKPISGYEESIGIYESYFTKAFEDKGFKWDVYVDTRDLKDYTDYPLMKCPTKLLKEYRCPIFKRRSFFQPYNDMLTETSGHATEELYHYLENETSYDVNLIWDNALRTMHMEDLYNSLHLDYILPKDYAVNSNPSKSKVALVMHLYFMDMLEESLHMAQSMPAGSDIYITAHTEEKVHAIQDAVSKMLPNYNVKILKIQNRGRDVSALMVGAAPYIKGYDYVCYFHDKKCTYVKPGTVGDGFKYGCYENALGSPAYVENIINTFDRNPRLGLLAPPAPNLGNYYPVVMNTRGWASSYDCTKKLADELELNVPISPDKRPITPIGSVFWFRMDAMRKLFDYPWTYEDFPAEPPLVDGTVMHAIERIYPYVGQAAGYYSAVAMSDYFARMHVVNLEYYAFELSHAAYKIIAPAPFIGLIDGLNHLASARDEKSRSAQVPFLRKCRNFIQTHCSKNVFYAALRIKRFFLPSKTGYYDIDIPKKVKQ